MPESKTHKRVKSKAAGTSGKTEVKLKSGRRVDAMTAVRAVEVQTSATPAALRQAARRLKETRKPQKVLIVYAKDMEKARSAMRDVGITGIVKSITGTKSTYVGARKTQSKAGHKQDKKGGK